MLTFGGSGNININFNHSENLYSNTFTLTGNGTWRDIYFNEDIDEYDKNKADALQLQQYNQTFFSSSYSYSGTIRPFFRNPIFAQTNVQYSFRGTLVRSKFTGDIDNPKWEFDWGEWEKEVPGQPGLTGHQLSSNIAANIMDKQQTLTFSTDLPPFDPAISSSATFRIWITDTNARIRMKKPEDTDQWEFEPLYITENFKFSNNGTLQLYMITNVDQNPKNEANYPGITTFTSTLSMYNFRLAFSGIRMRRWEFFPTSPTDPSSGGTWKQIPEAEEKPEWHPRDVSLNFNRTFSNLEIINNLLKASLSVNTTLFFNLQQHTNSYFNLILGLNLNITNFLELTLSTRSENSVIFRYFKDVPGMEYVTRMYPEGNGRQNNLFVDLFDSFNFFDDSKRQRTGFKMKNFRLSATHRMGDWNAILGLTMSPYENRNVTPVRWELNTDLTFLVQWVPISEIKTDLRYEKKTDRWTVQ
jgi:hypothetical protein